MRRFGTCMAIGALAGLALACSRARPQGPIVLVVVDTLRADHLSCYGYARPTSPEICALAADGVRFERAYTTRTATTPAIASMLTGLYPHRHGITDLYLVLPEAMTTLAERLHADGWATGAFVSSFVMVRDFSGFAQGFDVYDDDVRTRELLRENYQRDAPATVERAVDWLAGHGPRAFLFLHLIEPHGPYTPPAPYLERFALPATGPTPGPVPDYQRLPGVRTLSEFVGRYDGEIAAGDAALGELFAALRRRGWYDPATIILVADHGESFGEEGHWLCHGRSLNDAEAHVPLIVKFPAGSAAAPPPGTVVAAPVSVVDIHPTVLAAAGLAATGEDGVALELGAAAHGAPRPAPPVTELARDGAVTLAVHDDACTVRWRVPTGGNRDGAADVLAAARRLRIDPPEAGEACAAGAAAAAAALAADRASFQLAIPVVRRDDMRDEANRTRFINARQPSVPLAAHELEALRQLGYAE